MTLTPRQIAAYLEFNSRIDRIERADALMIAAMGAQGDSKAIEKTLKEMTETMALKFKATVDQPAWLKMIRDKQRPVATAAVAALRETAANSVQEGRRNIAGAGKFGPKWQEGLQFRMIDARGRRRAVAAGQGHHLS